MTSLHQLPAVLDIKVFAGDAWATRLEFTEAGSGYVVDAADFTAVLSSRSDTVLTVSQVDAFTLLVEGVPVDRGDHRWRLQHVASGRTWLAGWVYAETHGGSTVPGPGVQEVQVALGDTATVDMTLATFSGGGGGGGSHPNLASHDAMGLATDAELAAHEADTTAVHGIADTSALLVSGDIGVTVQAFNAVLAATTASFTTADESKLDGVEAGATADQSPTELLAAIKSVDGPGSLLDADLLDGLEATAFASAAQGATADSALQPADIGVSVASLSGGKIPVGELPPLAITDVAVVADITARDALTVEEGDVAIVQDTGSGDPGSFIYDGSVWQELATPAGGVAAVTASSPLVSSGGSTPNLTITGASSGAAGAMSASDKSKLDGIEAGADVTDAGNVAAAGAHMAGGTDVPVGDGGTGSSTASGARTNLGLAIGTNVQAHSAVLDGTTASFTTADESKLDGVEAGADVTDAANVAAAGAHMAGGVDVPVADGGTGASTAGAARSNLGLAIGADVQAHSAVLDATTASFTTADESKLDGIETGATADQTAAEVPITDSLALYTATNVEGALEEVKQIADAAAGGGISLEQVQDDLGNTSLVAGASLTKTYDDVANTITLDVDTGDFATAAQGSLADSALQAADIGVAVQGWDSDLDAVAAAGNSTVLAATTASFTTADESKLDGIETGATADQTAAEVPIVDAGTKYTATNVEDALAEVKDLADAGVTIEQVQDDLGNTSLVAGVSLTKTYDDGAGTITLDVDTGDFATAAQGSTADSAVQPGDVIPISDGGTGATTAGGARTALGVDAAGTDNSTPVTLSGTPDYLTIAGQTITRGLIDLATDVTGDLPVAEGGTGASNAGDARTNLGLAIGTNVQAFSSVLAATTASFTTADEAKLDYIAVTQPVDLDAIETRVNELDAAVVLQGSWDASTGSFPGGGTAKTGHSFIVSVSGTVDGVQFTANDRIVALTNSASTSTYASNWLKLDYTDAVLSIGSQTGAVTLADLGLVVGTHVQAQNANLQAVAGLTSAADKLAYFTGSGTAAVTDLSSFGRQLIDDANASAARTTLGVDAAGTDNSIPVTLSGSRSYVSMPVNQVLDIGPVSLAADVTGQLAVANGGTGATSASAARTSLGLVIGTNVQAQNANLQAVAGVTSAADLVPYFTGSGTAATMTVTAAARTVLDDTTVAAMRTTLGGGVDHQSDSAAHPLVANNLTSGSPYVLVLSDAGKAIEVNTAGAFTLRIPTNASVAFPVGTVITIYQMGVGQVTVEAVTPGTTTLRAPRGAKSGVQYGVASLWKQAADVWVLSGDVTS